MPTPIKIMVSLAVAIVAFAVYQLRHMMSPDLPSWIVPVLAAGMIVSMWIFPEASNKKKGPA